MPLANVFAQSNTEKDSMLVVHRIKKNETLSSIALKYSCSIRQLSKWNNLKNEDWIKEGDILKIWVKKSSTPIYQKPLPSADTMLKRVIPKKTTPRIIVNRYSDTPRVVKPKIEDDNLAFEGTRVAVPESLFDTNGRVKISGYITAYYARYSDSFGPGEYQKFPTSSPLNNSFSVNMIYWGAKYISNRYRGNLSLHWGDIPASAWSSTYNFIQEANAGFRITKGLWFEAGYFRTHIGLESIQPRENITTSIAVTTFYEPYFLSGAKLTYYLGDKLAFQGSVFNGFNSFVENNKSKAYGLSMVYNPNDRLSLTLNTLGCDESPDFQKRKQRRLYNDFYLSYKSPKLDFGCEFNYGVQENTKLSDTLKPATVISALIVGRYHFSKHFSGYLRGDYFDDRNQILTGVVLNHDNEQVGIHALGATAGMEIEPIPNSYFRIEYRQVQMLEKNQTLFYSNNTYSKIRHEIISAVGLWF